MKVCRLVSVWVLSSLLVACGGGGSSPPAAQVLSPTAAKPADLLGSGCNVQLSPSATYRGAASSFVGTAPGAAVPATFGGAITVLVACNATASAADPSGAPVARVLRLNLVALTNNTLAAGADYVSSLKLEERSAAGVVLREYSTIGDHSLRLVYADGKSHRFALNSSLSPVGLTGGGAVQLSGSFDVVNP